MITNRGSVHTLYTVDYPTPQAIFGLIPENIWNAYPSGGRKLYHPLFFLVQAHLQTDCNSFLPVQERGKKLLNIG